MLTSNHFLLTIALVLSACVPIRVDSQEANRGKLVVPNINALEPGRFRFDPFLGFDNWVLQSYDASQFAPLSQGGFLTAISLRSEEGVATGFDATYTHFELHLATFSQPISDMPTAFAPELLPDATVVFAQDNVRLQGNGSLSAAVPAPFEIRFQFERPFFYNSSSGNLLMYLRSGRFNSATGTKVDLEDRSVQPIGYILTSSGAGQGVRPSPDALIVQFEYTAIPEPASLSLFTCGLLVAVLRRYVNIKRFT